MGLLLSSKVWDIEKTKTKPPRRRSNSANKQYFGTLCQLLVGARGSLVVKALGLQAGTLPGFETRREMLINLILPVGPGVHSASNRNEYRKHLKNDLSVE
jgi:hypothetical protein